MNIGIVLHPYDEDKPAGLARTIFELTKGMLEVDTKNKYIIYLKKKPRMLPELPGSFRVEVLGSGWFWLEKLRSAYRADIYIFNTPMMPLFWKPPRSVVLALDFAYWYLAPKTVRGQASKWLTFFLHKRSLARAGSVVAISEATKKDLIHLFQLKEERIRVIYCGFKRISIVPEKEVFLPQKFFFFAGIIKPRKNVFNIVKAFHLFLEGYPDFSLVIGGNGSGEYYESIRSYVRDNNLEKKVLFTGHLNDGELSYVYKRAQAFVFPTLIEGFGYPVLEAMDCGIPVITSNQSSLAEVGGNGAALLVNPYNTDDIARGMRRMAGEPALHVDLRARGMQQSALFSWQKAAKTLLESMPNAHQHDIDGTRNKTILITLSRGILVRNFFHSGVIKKLLEEGFHVVVLIPKSWDPALFKEHSHPRLYFEKAPPLRAKHFGRLLDALSQGAIFNPTVYTSYKYGFAGKQPTKFTYIVNMLFFAPLRFVPFFPSVLRFIESKRNPGYEYDDILEKYKPQLVFNTAAGQHFGLFESARRHNILTVDMPKSWDTSSYMLFRSKAEYALAWGPFMSQQLMFFQRYEPQKIILTGTPQFDFYAAAHSHLLEREAFCRQFGFDPQKKIILYVSSGGDCFDEEDYIMHLKRLVETGAIDAQILIRPHLKYKNDITRFLPFETHGSFAVDRSDKRESAFRDNWDPSVGHIAHLFNSLYHADACVTIVSTIALDAAACGTEVVNIKFDIKKDISPYRSASRFYMTDYVDAAIKTGSSWVAKNEYEFLDALKAVLLRGEKKERERECLAQNIMYKNDGRAAERIAQTLKELALL